VAAAGGGVGEVAGVATGLGWLAAPFFLSSSNSTKGVNSCFRKLIIKLFFQA
jgi:hypothetical protein